MFFMDMFIFILNCGLVYSYTILIMLLVKLDQLKVFKCYKPLAFFRAYPCMS